MMKKTIYFLSIMVLSLLLALTAFAANPRFIDGVGLLSVEDADFLSKKLDEISETYQCDVIIVTAQTYDTYSIQAAADDFYDENGYGYGADDTGILLIISMTEREWAMSTCGGAIDIFSDRALMHLEDELMPYLLYEDYAGAFLRFAENCNDILASGGEEYADRYGNDDYHYNDYPYEEEPFDPLFWIPISVVIGFIISLLVVNVMAGEMTTVKMQNGASSYEKQGSFRVTQQQDIFLYRNISKTPRQTEQSRSGGSGYRGGSSTHRSSSGRSHGGRSGRF